MVSEKSAVRAEAILRRRAIAGDSRELANRQVFERAHKLDAFQLATRVHMYRSIQDEVDTWPFFEYAWGIGKQVYVPISTPAGLKHALVTRDTAWSAGPFGIPEPSIPESEMFDSASMSDASTHGLDFDVVIVPIVAFDKGCNRVGYGKGYYDRFLMHSGAYTMGLAFECQKVDALTAEDHDVRLRCVATDQRWYIA